MNKILETCISIANEFRLALAYDKFGCSIMGSVDCGIIQRENSITVMGRCRQKLVALGIVPEEIDSTSLVVCLDVFWDKQKSGLRWTQG